MALQLIIFIPYFPSNSTITLGIFSLVHITFDPLPILGKIPLNQRCYDTAHLHRGNYLEFLDHFFNNQFSKFFFNSPNNLIHPISQVHVPNHVFAQKAQRKNIRSYKATKAETEVGHV